MWWRDGRIQAVGAAAALARLVPRWNAGVRAARRAGDSRLRGRAHALRDVGAEPPAGAARRLAARGKRRCVAWQPSRRCRDGSSGRAGTPTAGIAPRTAQRSMRCSRGRSISIRWTCTPRGSTARPSRPPASDGTRPTRSAAASCVTPPASRPALLLERAVELMVPHLPEPPPALLDDGAAGGAGRGPPAGHHRHPRRRGRRRAGGLRATGCVGCAPAPRAVSSARHFARCAGAARDPERRRLGVAPDRRREDVPRRQPREPHRVDAGALRGERRSRHAHHVGGGGRARHARRRRRGDRVHRARDR